MSAIDEELARINQEMADADTAAQRAREMKQGPGDYDLRTATAGARAERQKQAALAAMQQAIDAEKLVLSEKIQQGLYDNVAQKPQKADMAGPNGLTEEVTTPSKVEDKHVRFNVGNTPYTLVEDVDDVRKQIKYMEDGNIDANSPVIPIGKRQDGGFILAAKADSGLNQELIPYTTTGTNTVANYPQAQSEPGRVGRLLGSGAADVSSIVDSEALEAIKGLNL